MWMWNWINAVGWGHTNCIESSEAECLQYFSDSDSIRLDCTQLVIVPTTHVKEINKDQQSLTIKSRTEYLNVR
jgi:hypothetical protein